MINTLLPGELDVDERNTQECRRRRYLAAQLRTAYDAYPDLMCKMIAAEWTAEKMLEFIDDMEAADLPRIAKEVGAG